MDELEMVAVAFNAPGFLHVNATQALEMLEALAVTQSWLAQKGLATEPEKLRVLGSALKAVRAELA